jgi:O-antigen/teichoic acid export membrane protein
MKFKLAKRALTIGWSTINILSGAVFSVLLSVLVIRSCSKELWGSMVEVLLWFGLASHLLNFGNENLLLREFSLMPKDISANWGKSLQARSLLYLMACIVLFFLPIEIGLKLLLLIYLSANFLYRSYDVVIRYKLQFPISVFLETIGFLFIAVFIFFERSDLSLTSLVAVYTGAELLKTAILFVVFKSELKLPSLSINLVYFSLAFPFFILEFTGLLQSKTDLICVTFFLTKEKVAQYQVYINFLLIVQSAAGFILVPFIKNIYRMKSESVAKLSLQFFGFGAIIAFLSLFFVNSFINYFYHFTIPSLTLIIGTFFIMPIFYYTLVIYQLLKLKKQKTVVILNIVGVIISFTLNIIFITQSKDGISGAILAVAITQWIVLFIYAGIQRKLTSVVPFQA